MSTRLRQACRGLPSGPSGAIARGWWRTKGSRGSGRSGRPTSRDSATRLRRTASSSRPWRREPRRQGRVARDRAAGLLHDPHFNGYPAILNALRRARAKAVRAAICDGFTAVAASVPIKKPAASRSRKPRRGSSRPARAKARGAAHPPVLMLSQIFVSQPSSSASGVAVDFLS